MAGFSVYYGSLTPRLTKKRSKKPLKIQQRNKPTEQAKYQPPPRSQKKTSPKTKQTNQRTSQTKKKPQTLALLKTHLFFNYFQIISVIEQELGWNTLYELQILLYASMTMI